MGSINTLILQECIKLIKIDNNITKYFCFEINAFELLNHKNNPQEFPQKNIKRCTAVFNIDNSKKCFLSGKSA